MASICLSIMDSCATKHTRLIGDVPASALIGTWFDLTFIERGFCIRSFFDDHDVTVIFVGRQNHAFSFRFRWKIARLHLKTWFETSLAMNIDARRRRNRQLSDAAIGPPRPNSTLSVHVRRINCDIRPVQRNKSTHVFWPPQNFRIDLNP